MYEPPQAVARAIEPMAVRTRTRRVAGFTLVEVLVVVAILGILASAAIPAVSGYMRRTKTAEARVNLAKMYDSTAAYFAGEHVDRGQVETIGTGSTTARATHLCPTPLATPAGGEAGFTPSIDCSVGPGGRCVPSGAPAGAGYYDIAEWTDNSVWAALNFAQEQGHYFHYNFRSTNTLTGFGDCQFTASAYGNLDGDAVFSTFERSGAADIHGVNAASGLYIDLVIE